MTGHATQHHRKNSSHTHLSQNPRKEVRRGHEPRSNSRGLSTSESSPALSSEPQLRSATLPSTPSAVKQASAQTGVHLTRELWSRATPCPSPVSCLQRCGPRYLPVTSAFSQERRSEEKQKRKLPKENTPVQAPDGRRETRRSSRHLPASQQLRPRDTYHVL